MKIWLDAHLSPKIASWLNENFDVTATSLRDLNLRHAKDNEIHQRAKDENVVVMTKDNDFILMLDKFGPPPKIIWLTCGNTSNAALKILLKDTFLSVIKLLENGEPLVEMSG